jgi:hypothetical protein
MQSRSRQIERVCRPAPDGTVPARQASRASAIARPPCERRLARAETNMRGLIMDRPLLVSSIIDHAAERYGAVEMVSCTADAPVRRTTYAALRPRA